MTASNDVLERARATSGTSGEAIYRLVARALVDCLPAGATLLDVGCGTGQLREYAGDRVGRYIGADVLRHDDFPESAEFVAIDPDSGHVPLPDGSAEVVAAVETIEHLENPRAFVREMARPGGWVVLTTPNQLSLLSKLSLALRNQFPAFREAPGLYPAHLSALLEVDQVRIALECGLADPEIRYTDSGRIPGTAWPWPDVLRGRAFSDNVLLRARRP